MTDMQLDLDLPVEDQQKLRDEWCNKIKGYYNSFEKWTRRCEKIVNRYRDEREANDDGASRVSKYNILWSNVQTLGPAVYSKPPKPEVTRRYFDKDPIGRLSSAVLERALQYEMDVTDFDGEVLKCRDDYLLTARGTLWQRYEPIIEKAAQDTDGEEDDNDIASTGEIMGEPQSGVEAMGANGGPSMDRVIGENAPTDYVHWKDFLHGPAQNWKQVPWIGRRVLLDKASVDARWPSPPGQPPLSSKLSFTHKQEPDNDKDKNAQQSKSKGNLALIYELWDKTKFKVIWYSEDLKDRVIEEADDPLQLTDFFPCPQPLYATMTTDRLVPVPDYKLYQDQAVELDTLTQRIDLLVKAIAVRGMYDASNGKLADLLNERPENFMLPVDNWAAFAEKGGLNGQVSFVPIDQVMKVAQALQAARTQVIQDIYAITGISDIVRGASVASETATAQQIKGQFANLRLNNRRDAMAKFLREALRIKAEVISEHFDETTLRKISGFDQMTEVTSAVTSGQGADQLWSQVYQMLKDDPLRLTHLDVETDSMIDTDMQEEQQSRVQFLQAVGGFLQQALQAAQEVPSLAPLLGQMLAFAVRGFKVGRELESSIDAALDHLSQLAANPPQKPPPPDVIEAQTRQMETQRLTQNDQAKNKITADKNQADIALAQQKQKDDAAFDRWQAEENLKLAREELMLKYGVAPFVEAAAQQHDTDAGAPA